MRSMARKKKGKAALKPPTAREIEKRAKEICLRMIGGLCPTGTCGACRRDAELELYRDMFA